jgi:hypothetical protein
MLEPSGVDNADWASMSLGTCPTCGSPKLVPAVAGWRADRYCLECKTIVEPASGQTDQLSR